MIKIRIIAGENRIESKRLDYILAEQIRVAWSRVEYTVIEQNRYVRYMNIK